MRPNRLEAAPGAAGRRSDRPLAALARGLTPPPILVVISRGGRRARRRGGNPRFPRGEEGSGTTLEPRRTQKVPTDSAEEAKKQAAREARKKAIEPTRETFVEERVRRCLEERGYSVESRHKRTGPDMVAHKDGRSLLVEVKGDRPGHIDNSGLVDVDVHTLLGQVVTAMGQGLADEYAVAVRPIHMRVLTKAMPVLARLGIQVLLVENESIETVSP